MNNKKQSSQKILKVIIPPQVQQGVFSNVAKVSLTEREVVIDFAFRDPNTTNAILVSRVILTKEHAIDLWNVLGRVLGQHERKEQKN